MALTLTVTLILKNKNNYNKMPQNLWHEKMWLGSFRSVTRLAINKQRDMTKRNSSRAGKQEPRLKTPVRRLSLNMTPRRPHRRFRSRGWISGYRTAVKKLLVNQMEVSRASPIPWEGATDKDHLKETDRIKSNHCLLRGCSEAFFMEEMMSFPIMVRITLYVQGHVRILGSRYDHGPPVVGDTRPEAVRIARVLRAIRADFMRHTGLWDQGNIEAVALTFHPELFDQGQLLTNSGGIPGCPGPLTESQQEEHRASSQDIMECMVELQRRRMKFNADRTRDETLHPEQRFQALHIMRAAAEMHKLCEFKRTPQCAVDLYHRMYETRSAEDI
jgi:hypothetical protein